MLTDTVIKHNHKTIQSRRPVTDWHRPLFLGNSHGELPFEFEAMYNDKINPLGQVA